MSVVVSCEDVGPCRKEVKIEVPAPAIEAEMQRVVREYAKKSRISGFRKGKVPPSLVKKRFRSEIDQEVLERLLPRYWRQAEAEASLVPLMAPRIGDDVKLEDGKPLVFVATVEVRPEIEVSEDREFELPDATVDVGEAEVEEAIERLRSEVAPWKTVERPAARADLVRLRLWQAGEEAESPEEPEEPEEPEDPEVPKEAGPEPAGAEGSGDQEGADSEPQDASPEAPGQEISIEVGEERVWEELSLAVTGLAARQRGSFSRREAPAEPEEGQVVLTDPPTQRDFELEVLEVQEKELPALDDELAKSVGEFDNLAALGEAVEKRIRFEKEAARRHEREHRLMEQLRERHPLELPEAVVDQEVRSMLESYAENLSHRGVDVPNVELDWNAVAEQARPQAQGRVHGRLVLDAVADHDRIEVPEEEFERALAALAKAEGQSTGAMRQALDRAGRLATMRQHMRREKTIKHLLGEGGEPDTTPEKGEDE